MSSKVKMSRDSINKNKIFTAKGIRTFTLSSIALISAVLSIYAFFFNEATTNLEYQIIGDIKVYDLNSESSKIDIFFNKKLLDKERENLRIINLKIINTGSEKILKSYYDDNDKLGLHVENAVLLENPEVINTSNAYLQKNLKISTDTLNNFFFSDVILEPEEFYTIKLLIKHPLDSIYNITPRGKIAGVRELRIINRTIDAEKESGFISFTKKTFKGNLYIQLTRFLSYGLVILIIFIGAIFLIINIQEKKEKKMKDKKTPANNV